MRIRFQPEAEAELAEARTWYALQGKELDSQLMLRIDETLKRIIEAPEAYPSVYRQLRPAVVHQFPYRDFLCAHARRDSGARGVPLETQSEEMEIETVAPLPRSTRPTVLTPRLLLPPAPAPSTCILLTTPSPPSHQTSSN